MSRIEAAAPRVAMDMQMAKMANNQNKSDIHYFQHIIQ